MNIVRMEYETAEARLAELEADVAEIQAFMAKQLGGGRTDVNVNTADLFWLVGEVRRLRTALEAIIVTADRRSSSRQPMDGLLDMQGQAKGALSGEEVKPWK